jgi:hypothetical protein
MRSWISALVVGLSLGCSSGGAMNDGGAGSGGAVGGGGQAGGVAGQAGGAAGQAGGAAGQAGGAAGQAGGTAGQASGVSGNGGPAGAGGRGGSAGGGAGASGGVSGSAGGSAGGNGGRGGTSGSGGATDGGVSGCAMLAGLSFDSLDERECGLAPPDAGASRCRWRITFTDATMFSWRHSDYIESGSYSCSTNTITAQTQTRGTVTAILDPAVWRFTWDSVVYACTACPP